MYILIRILILVLLTLLIAWICRRKKYHPPVALMIIYGIVLAILYGVSLFIPFESILPGYATPETAFRIANPTENILQVIEDEDCAFIIFGKDGSDVKFSTVNKRGGRWRPCNIFNGYDEKLIAVGQTIATRLINTTANKQCILIKETQINNPNDRLDISDNASSKFNHFSFRLSNMNIYTNIYYSIMPFESHYSLTVNGQTRQFGS